ncbi:MAG: hypothetical protein RL163_2529, partial [Pseudomonadota bacterium]
MAVGVAGMTPRVVATLRVNRRAVRRPVPIRLARGHRPRVEALRGHPA